jgi:hypothetical protein
MLGDECVLAPDLSRVVNPTRELIRIKRVKRE